MKMLRLLGGSVLVLSLATVAYASDPAAAPSHASDPVPAAGFISASDGRFRYEGRFDTTDTMGPVVIWQASRIRFGFEGDAVTLRFAELKDQVFFDATVDGKTTLLAMPLHSSRERIVLSGYGPGVHQLVLFKRSEAAAGRVRFLGVELPAGQHLVAAARPTYATTMLFIGDSITVGACNEDGPEDQWADRSTHNAALSYAALTAAAFQADHRNIAVSGMGVVTGWVPQIAGSTWDRVYPDMRSPVAELGEWQPNVIFVNLGENDNSFTAAHGQPFPPAFADQYVALVRSVRHRYPGAEIVILRGGMAGGATSPELRAAWETAVATLEKSDPQVTHFAFKHWSKTHPRVADDQMMADELVAWLKPQHFVAAAQR